jgi:tRNA (adenine22-N1)-methyltransferase
MLKLSKRLQQLDKLVTTNYDHIWDCCCDHGFLGSALLTRQAANIIHFVDIVPELMSALNYKLNQFYPEQNLNAQAGYDKSTSNKVFDESLWKTHCIDVNTLPLQQYQGKHLVIIAGVGGDLMSEFVTSICQQHPQLHIDFLLCPVHHQYTLRKQLSNLDLTLKQEVLIEENKRFYEALLLSSATMLLSSAINSSHKPNLKLTLAGESLWQAKNEQEYKTAQQYLSKTLQHYRRIQQGGRVDVASIIEDYEAVKIKLFKS